MEEIRTIKDAMKHLELVAAEDPYNGGAIAYTGKDLADAADRILSEGRWADFVPFSERDVKALIILRDWISLKEYGDWMEEKE